METVIFLFASVTYATKARRLLSAGNIPSRPTKSDAPDSISGCRHGLAVAPADYRRAVGIFKENGISFEVRRR